MLRGVFILIASRRQVDSEEFEGGYVENYTTKSFSRYVHSQEAPLIYLARDHGGPYQNSVEVESKASLDEAMASAKRSFESDISAGFRFIHIDPSIPIGNEELTLEKVLDRLFELYEHCHEFAGREGKTIEFELGTEEQGGYGQDHNRFEYFLEKTLQFCERNAVRKPRFVVAQTGTKVLETQNVGIFKKDVETETGLSLEHLVKTISLCNRFGVYLKEHNTDYLSNEALALRPILGIHACNVAPEFGVAETKALLYLLSIYGFEKELQEFIHIAVESRKWVKWMLPDSSATDFDKAIICGHYVFSDPRVREIKSKVQSELKRIEIDLEQFLKRNIAASIMRYVHLFNPYITT